MAVNGQDTVGVLCTSFKIPNKPRDAVSGINWNSHWHLTVNLHNLANKELLPCFSGREKKELRLAVASRRRILAHFERIITHKHIADPEIVRNGWRTQRFAGS